jgi:hypothetical protein
LITFKINNMVIHIHESVPPQEDIAGNTSDILYNHEGAIAANDNLKYIQTGNPTIAIATATANGVGEIQLGGTTGSGKIATAFLTLDSSSVVVTGTPVANKPSIELQNTNPSIGFTKPNNGANMKKWNMWLDGSGNLYTDSVMDDDSSSEHAVQITRTGRTVTSHRLFANGAIILNVGASSVNVATDLYGAGIMYSKGLSVALNPAVVAGPTNTGMTVGAATNYANINLYDATQPVDRRSADIINFQGSLQFRLKNDTGANVVTPLRFNGGYAGYTGIQSNGNWTHSGGPFIAATPGTVGNPSLLISSTVPRQEFLATNGSAGRKRWGIDATGGVWFGFTLQQDDGTNQAGVYRVFNGTNTIGGHLWNVGGNTATNTPPVQAMAIQSSTGNNVSIGPNNPVPSAILDLQSTTKGFSLPSMTSAQRTAIPSPVQGLMVYDTDKKAVCLYIDTKWNTVSMAVITPEEAVNPTGPTDPAVNPPDEPILE